MPKAVARVFELKERDTEKSLPVLAADQQSLGAVARFDTRADRLAERFWPGPLTIVLPRATGFTPDLGAEHDTVAVRVPDSEAARGLLRASGPLAVTSANRSGEAPVDSIEAARSLFGDSVGAYLDGGRLQGEPSTVVSLIDDLRVLRLGAISEDDLHQTLAP